MIVSSSGEGSGSGAGLGGYAIAGGSEVAKVGGEGLPGWNSTVGVYGLRNNDTAVKVKDAGGGEEHDGEDEEAGNEGNDQ